VVIGTKLAATIEMVVTIKVVSQPYLVVSEMDFQRRVNLEMGDIVLLQIMRLTIGLLMKIITGSGLISSH